MNPPATKTMANKPPLTGVSSFRRGRTGSGSSFGGS